MIRTTTSLVGSSGVRPAKMRKVPSASSSAMATAAGPTTPLASLRTGSATPAASGPATSLTLVMNPQDTKIGRAILAQMMLFYNIVAPLRQLAAQKQSDWGDKWAT